MFLTSASGDDIIASFDYFPYGKKIELAVTSEHDVTQTFTGKEQDRYDDDMSTGEDGEGWYYFGVRYYDADVGRWISTDPAGQFFDLYAYAGNGFNPIIATDPTGSILKIQGSFQFRREARSAIKTLESKPIGNALVNTLRKSDNKFVITNKLTDFQSAVQNLLKKPYNGAPYENLENSRNGKGAGGTATLSLQDVELSTIEGPQLAPLYIRMAHELSHLEEYNFGIDSGDKTFVPGTNVPVGEKGAVQKENWIRQEHGVPERDKY